MIRTTYLLLFTGVDFVSLARPKASVTCHVLPQVLRLGPSTSCAAEKALGYQQGIKSCRVMILLASTDEDLIRIAGVTGNRTPFSWFHLRHFQVTHCVCSSSAGSLFFLFYSSPLLLLFIWSIVLGRPFAPSSRTDLVVVVVDPPSYSSAVGFNFVLVASPSRLLGQVGFFDPPALLLNFFPFPSLFFLFCFPPILSGDSNFLFFIRRTSYFRQFTSGGQRKTWSTWTRNAVWMRRCCVICPFPPALPSRWAVRDQWTPPLGRLLILRPPVDMYVHQAREWPKYDWHAIRPEIIPGRCRYL